jgi:hypothetical protein
MSRWPMMARAVSRIRVAHLAEAPDDPQAGLMDV